MLYAYVSIGACVRKLTANLLQEWFDVHISSFFAVGAPLLGAAEAHKGLVCAVAYFSLSVFAVLVC